MITIEHSELARQHTRGLITDREYAEEVYRLALAAHPFLAINDPHAVLCSVAGLPRKVAEAHGVPEPRELAEQLLAGPDLAPSEQRYVPLRPFIALLVYRVDGGAAGERPSYTGKLVGVGGRELPGDREHFVGPWFSRRPGTLIAIALDDAATLDHLEQAERSGTAVPASQVAALA